MTTSVRWLLITLLLLGSLASLVAFGILGKGRGGDGVSNFDGAVLYAAGRAWRDGKDPYNHAQLQASVADEPAIKLEGILFFYLPQASPLCLALAPFPYAVAKQLWLGVNLLSIAALAAMALVLLRRSAGAAADPLALGLLAAVVVGNPFTAHVVWMGQTSLLAAAFTLAAWLFHQRKQWLWAGLFLGLASLKPQLCVLFGIWLLLERDWKTLLTGLTVSVLLCLHPLMVYGGPVGMVEAWSAGAAAYKPLPFNQPGDPHVGGLESLLAAAGVAVPGVFFTLTGFALAVAVWVFRQRLNQDDVLGILMGITLVFVGFSHDYDYVFLVPLFVALWFHCGRRPTCWLLVLPLLVLLFLPQQLVRKLDIAVLNHWRTLVILLLTLLLVRLSLKRPSQHGQTAVRGAGC